MFLTLGCTGATIALLLDKNTPLSAKRNYSAKLAPYTDS